MSNLSPFYRQLVINAFSTAASTVVIHSWDTAKNRVICGDTGSNLLSGLLVAVDDEAILYHVLHNVSRTLLEITLYRGLDSAVTKILSVVYNDDQRDAQKAPSTFFTIVRRCLVSVASGVIATCITHPLDFFKLQHSVSRVSDTVWRGEGLSTRKVWSHVCSAYSHGLSVSVKHYSMCVALSVLSYDCLSLFVHHEGDRAASISRNTLYSPFMEQRHKHQQRLRERNRYIYTSVLLVISKLIPEYLLFPLEVKKIQQMSKQDTTISSWLIPRKTVTKSENKRGLLYSVISNLIAVPVHFAFYSLLNNNLPL